MVAEFVKTAGCFLNLNELEFSDTNAEEMKKRGYVLVNDESNTVLGSAEVAKRAFETGCSCDSSCGGGDSGGDSSSAGDSGAGTGSSCGRINFCSSRYKDAVQLRLRLLRTARQYARPFDEITEDGTILFGRIDVPDSLLEFVSFLEENELPQEAYVINAEKKTVETAVGIAEELASIFEEDGADFEKFKIWIIEQYPFDGGFVVGSERIF